MAPCTEPTTASTTCTHTFSPCLFCPPRRPTRRLRKAVNRFGRPALPFVCPPAHPVSAFLDHRRGVRVCAVSVFCLERRVAVRVALRVRPVSVSDSACIQCADRGAPVKTGMARRCAVSRCRVGFRERFRGSPCPCRFFVAITSSLSFGSGVRALLDLLHKPGKRCQHLAVTPPAEPRPVVNVGELPSGFG